MENRVRRIQEKLKEERLPALLVGQDQNRFYLSGFSGSGGWVLLTGEGAYLLTDFRYVEQARQQARDYKVIRYKGSLSTALAPLLEEVGLVQVGFEEDFLSYGEFRKLKEGCPKVQWVPVSGMVEELRLQKDKWEVEAIRRASQLDVGAFEYILGFVQPGRQEREIALELECFGRRRGGERASFEIIVASGVRSALPHGVATTKTLQRGEFVTMDFGTVVHGYHSDFTRTVVLGEASPKQEKIYRVVQVAQEAAIEAIGPGRSAADIDAVARKIIARHGLEDYFGHGLGHGVGLSVHEGPRLAPGSDAILQPGMVITVEPGVYIPHWGGVRIEDLVLITRGGYEILSQCSRELLVLS